MWISRSPEVPLIKAFREFFPLYPHYPQLPRALSDSRRRKIYGQNDHFRCLFAYAILHLSNYAILPQISTDPQRLGL